MGQTMGITAAPGACSPAAPCRLVIRLDETEAAAGGVTPANAVVLRNGNPVPGCPDSPRCVDVRDRFGNGDIRLVVLADEVSDWNVGREPRAADCRGGGWRDLTNADGRPFKNQGACVSDMRPND
jgi:hypothetical protein